MGYESTEADTVVRAVESENGTLLAKLEESPFYPEGGGQVSDHGTVATTSGRARVTDVFRLGSDQALALEPVEGELAPGEEVHAEVDRATRLATMRNHTATHLLHAALRERLGEHVRQAGSYVGPDKLRFDFSHGERLSDEEVADVEAAVNGWIADNLPVRAIETSLDEARSLGAMALFGEKYGDWVRMVEVDEVSRELCGGTHVHTTGEVGLFHVTTETSSASNVRRIEAVTGAAATGLFEERTARLRELSKLMKAPEIELVRAAERLGEQVSELKKKPAAAAADDGAEAERLVALAAGRRRCEGAGSTRRGGGSQGAAGPVRPRAAEAGRCCGGARHGGRRPHGAGGQRGARPCRARRKGRRAGARRGRCGRRGRRRPGHRGAGRRRRPGEARRGAGGRTGGGRAGAGLVAGRGT